MPKIRQVVDGNNILCEPNNAWLNTVQGLENLFVETKSSCNHLDLRLHKVE